MWPALLFLGRLTAGQRAANIWGDVRIHNARRRSELGSLHSALAKAASPKPSLPNSNSFSPPHPQTGGLVPPPLSRAME